MSLGQNFALKLGAEWQSENPLILPEVWDVASARLLANANFPVLTTSAASFAWAQGYRPGERVGLEELLVVAARIIRDGSLPLIADLEGCFDRSNEMIQKCVKAALSIGAAGVTIGDGGREGMHQMQTDLEVANRIKSSRIAAIELRRTLTIIARTDTFYLGAIISNPIEEAVRRAKIYLDAGADMVQIAGVQHISIVKDLSAAIQGPIGINVTMRGAANIDEYRSANITAISLGTGLMRSAFTDMGNKVKALMQDGEFNYLNECMSETDLSKLLCSEPSRPELISVNS